MLSLIAPRTNDNEPEVSREAWAFLDGTSQEFALATTAQHILFHGTRGPGKTDCQLARFAANVGIGYGTYWVGVIFDRRYKNLDDLIKKSKRMFPKIFGKACKFLSSNSDLKWVWDTGEELLFRQYQRADDYWNYHGQEYPFIGWNELCKYPTSEAYDSMMSCNRSSWTQAKDSPVDEETGEYLVPAMPLEVFSTTNPYGPGHNWVKAKFIDAGPMGEIVYNDIEVFDPKTQQDITIRRSQIAIFGSYKENPYLDAIYVAELESITDPNKRAAWLEGDWDVVAGGALDDVWRKDIHVVPRFVIPDHWRVDRAMDWGSSHPCAIAWFAECNGEEAEIEFEDGSIAKYNPPKGTLIVINELYRTEKPGSNKGKRESAHTIAQLVINREIAMLEAGWITQQPWPGPADNQIANNIDTSVDSIKEMMAKQGVRWTESDKWKGSRKVGLQLMRDRFEATMKGKGDAPGMLVMDNCVTVISTFPTLPRDEDDLDDVDTDAEDHMYDGVRYRVLAGSNREARELALKMAN